MVQPVDSIMDDNIERGVKQPLIIALGMRGYVNQVFLVVEGHDFEIRHGIIAAVDRWIKLHLLSILLFLYLLITFSILFKNL